MAASELMKGVNSAEDTNQTRVCSGEHCIRQISGMWNVVHPEVKPQDTMKLISSWPTATALGGGIYIHVFLLDILGVKELGKVDNRTEGVHIIVRVRRSWLRVLLFGHEKVVRRPFRSLVQVGRILDREVDHVPRIYKNR